MLVALAAAAWAAVTPPEQVRINLGKQTDSMVANWVTMGSDGGSSAVEWGPTASFGSRAAGDSRNFTQDTGRFWFSHVAIMTSLKENTTYYYRVGDSLNGWSATFSFVHRRQPSKGEPFRHIIFGDMGSACAFTLCDKCSKHSEVCDATTCAGRAAGLVSEVDTAGMWVHTGDFAYDLGSNNGKTGDQFFRNIEQIAASVPYMVSHGNHEDSSSNLAHYVESFRGQPVNSIPATFNTANGEAANSLYFSWDYGLVHYVAISTELWFGVESRAPAVNKTTMLDWIRKDLAAANRNRDATPWIVVHGHRSIYCSCDGDCSGDAEKVRADMEPILMEYGVDFFINGHEHNYERSYPLYQGKSDKSNVNPKAPIYVVTGAAGSHEMHEPFTRLQPAWSAFRSNSFGYSRMLVYNATHIHWQQVQTDPTWFRKPHYGRVIDDAWIVQHNHGPFSISEAPQSVGRCEPGKCDTHDHWMPLLGIDAAEGTTSVDAIAAFRRTHGEAAWVEKLNGLMRRINLNSELPSNGKAVSLEQRRSQRLSAVGDALGLLSWEDVRADGSSDGAVFRWRNGHA